MGVECIGDATAVTASFRSEGTLGIKRHTASSECRSEERHFCAQSSLSNRLHGFRLTALDAAEYGVEDHLVPQSLFASDFKRPAFFDCGGKGLNLRSVGAVIQHLPF